MKQFSSKSKKIALAVLIGFNVLLWFFFQPSTIESMKGTAQFYFEQFTLEEGIDKNKFDGPYAQLDTRPGWENYLMFSWRMLTAEGDTLEITINVPSWGWNEVTTYFDGDFKKFPKLGPSK